MNKSIYILVFTLLSLYGYSQEILRVNDAVRITLKNDYNIKVAENSSNISLNNASIYNNNYLPKVTGRAGVNYRNQKVDIDYHNAPSSNVSGSSALGYSGSLGLNYTLFDGMYRSYNYEKSKELYNLSQLQVRQVIEATLLEMFTGYYTVANLTETTESLKQSLSISKVRLLRAQYGAEYGTKTQLDVLNAEVDVNTDSISFLNSKQNLANAKRNLNVLMGRNVTDEFAIDTLVSYEVLYALDTLMTMAKAENIRLLSTQKSLELNEFDIKLFQTNRIPTIGLNGSYAWNNTNYNDKNSMAKQTVLGPQAEISLVWNIFDGGRTKTGVQNAIIATETSLVKQEQTQKYVERDVINAYTTYKNSLFVMEAERVNLTTNKRNFDRSSEQYQLGQLTSVEFRQAQLNSLRAETRFNQAKYQAKIYELALFKLTGELMNMKF
ncbi:MAG: TolC family protein [Salinivirgaceae bacterium]|nr:TolC family protein [Salinivirgaceae bacterium]